MDNYGYMAQIRALRDEFRMGRIAGDALIDRIAGIAYETGTPGEPEQFITMLAYEYITDLPFNEDDWA